MCICVFPFVNSTITTSKIVFFNVNPIFTLKIPTRSAKKHTAATHDGVEWQAVYHTKGVTYTTYLLYTYYIHNNIIINCARAGVRHVSSLASCMKFSPYEKAPFLLRRSRCVQSVTPKRANTFIHIYKFSPSLGSPLIPTPFPACVFPR